MPVATGSISFLGASRFQGNWDVIGNDGTGSALAGAPSSNYSTLLTDGGYHNSTLLTASQGDYWQVIRSDPDPGKNTTINGYNNWTVNDWCIYSGSQWLRLPFDDTIASIVIGDLTSGSFHMAPNNNEHIIFSTGSVLSGSRNLTYDYDSNSLLLTGNFHLSDDKRLYFGSNADAYIEYDEAGKNHMVISGSITGLALSGSKLILDSRTVQSGTTAGPGSFLGINASSQVILTSSLGTISALNNRAENRLVTIGSPTTELDGEANLTFDGGNFSLTGSANIAGLVSAVATGNTSSINTNTTIPPGYNYVMYGPITIIAGKTLTVSDTANLKIKDISDL